MYLRFRDKNGAAITDGWWEIGTIRSGKSKVFNIKTGIKCCESPKEKIRSIDYEIIYSENGEIKLGGEGTI